MTKTNRLTTQQLADMRNRADKATEGPWEYYSVNGKHLVDVTEWVDIDIAYHTHKDGEANGKFIAHSRQDIPALLSEVETLIAEKAQTRRKLDATSGILLEYIRQGQSHVSIEVMQTLVDHLRKDLIDHGA